MQFVYSIHLYVHSSCNYILLYLCSSITEEINKYVSHDWGEQGVALHSCQGTRQTASTEDAATAYPEAAAWFLWRRCNQTDHNSMYSMKRILPTLSNVQEELNDAIGYQGSLESIRRLLEKLGFYYKRCQTNLKRSARTYYASESDASELYDNIVRLGAMSSTSMKHTCTATTRWPNAGKTTTRDWKYPFSKG